MLKFGAYTDQKATYIKPSIIHKIIQILQINLDFWDNYKFRTLMAKLVYYLCRVPETKHAVYLNLLKMMGNYYTGLLLGTNNF